MQQVDKKQNTGRWSVRHGWFFSYLLVLAVPLVLCLLLYAYTSHVITQESQRIYGSSLEQVRIDLDAYVEEINQVLEQMLMDKSIQLATHIKEKATPKEQLNLIDAEDSLNSLQVSHPHISSLFVALNRPDTVISTKGHMSQTLFYQLYCQSAGMTENQFRAQVRAKHPNWDMVPLTRNDGSVLLLFMRTTMDTGLGSSNATAVVAIEQTIFQQRLAQFQWDKRLNLYVVRPDDMVICHTGTRAASGLSYANLKESANFSFVQQGGMLVRTSKQSQWRYLLLADTDLLLQNARTTQGYTFLGMLFCLLLGLFLSIRLTKYNYGPLHRLVGLYAPKAGEAPTLPQSKNEYEQLDHYVQQFFREKGDAQHELWNSQQMLHKYYLYSLLEHPQSWTRTAHPAGQAALQLPGPCYIAVLFLNPLPPLGSATEEENRSYVLTQFAILNIFQDVAGHHFTLETTDMGETATAILSLPDLSDAWQKQLAEDIQFTEQRIQEYFHLNVTAAMGSPHRGDNAIHRSYTEALEALACLRAGEDADIMSYEEVRDARHAYPFTLETEHKMLDLMAAGSTENVAKLIRQVFPITGAEAIVSPSIQKCLVYDITAALIKGANDVGVTDLGDIQFIQFEHITAPELLQYLLDTAALLCEKVRHIRAESTLATQLCHSVQAYIRENYQDADLNISQTGLHFNITPAYLSAIFKRETGSSLLGYINEVRLKAAKELLLQGVSVVQIAERVGFRDSGSLIRVFKKDTGLTPGQYKAAHTGRGG
ncbi:MAG: helix-turn-helix transcriptional regulator [Gemmiger sp.]|nr:helix-turn-helix transcriptional regulator [Gemmiger sp.]